MSFVLDARPSREGGLEVLAYDGVSLESRRLPGVLFRIYLKPLGLDARVLERSIEDSGLAEAWIEEWLSPPDYSRSVELVVAESRHAGQLSRLAAKAEEAGVAYRVNTYPGMVVEALHRSGVWPGYRVRLRSDGGEVLEDPSDPLYEPPDLLVARLRAVSWHGPAVSLGERIRGFLVEIGGEELGVLDYWDVVEAIEAWRPAVVMARHLDLMLLDRAAGEG